MLLVWVSLRYLNTVVSLVLLQVGVGLLYLLVLLWVGVYIYVVFKYRRYSSVVGWDWAITFVSFVVDWSVAVVFLFLRLDWDWDWAVVFIPGLV